MQKIERVRIDDIRIGERRRRDLGDIPALARNIDEHGLLHPIIIAADNTLIAGERRLRAHHLLGLSDIDARRWPDLTEEERREIELAENLNRKDLTPEERNRNLTALAEAVEEVLTEPVKTRNGGRPPKGRVPEQAVADRIGIPRTTLSEARRHVAAIDAYPELTPFAQTDALKIAAKLDAMPEPERVEARAAVMAHDGATLARLTDRPPLPNGPTPHQQAANDPAGRLQDDLHALWKKLNGVRDFGGVGRLTAPWPREQKLELLAETERIAALMGEWYIEIKEQLA